MISCITTLSCKWNINFNTELVLSICEQHKKALELFPALSQHTVIDKLDIPDGIISYDQFSDGKVVAKLSGYAVQKDKDTGKLYTIWSRWVVGKNT